MFLPFLDKEVVKVLAPNILRDDDGVSLLHPIHGKHLHHILVTMSAQAP